MRRGLTLSSLCGAAICVLLPAIVGYGQQTAPSTAPAAKAVPLRDQMRTLRQPARPSFIMDYLVCGPFEEPVSSAASSAPSSEPIASGAVDYLAQAGGEAAAAPTEGQTLTTPQGAQFTWQRHSSKADRVDLTEVFPAAKDKSCVAYAYATVRRDRPTRAVIVPTGRAILTIYLNGKRIVGPEDRRGVWEGYYFPVSLNEGDNSLLVRVAGPTNDWKFSLRTIDEADLPTDNAALLRAEIVPDESDPSALVVSVGNDNSQPCPTVAVAVIGQAGRIAAQADVPLRQTHRFDATSWPDGPYEVRAMAKTPEGVPMTRYRMWYKGDWRKEMSAVMDETDRLSADSSDPVVLKKLLARQLIQARLGGDIRQIPATQTIAQGNVNRAAAALLEYREAAPQQQSPPAAGGFFRLAWRDEVDGSPQYARAFLPLNYDPNRKYPLVIWLHGYDARNRDYAGGESGARHKDLAEQYDVIYMEPFGRGNTAYQGIGEADVMRAVAEAKSTFSVDDERIYLYGGSMGGGGVWHVGTRHTDVFAAIAPIYGGWDYHGDTKDEEFAKWSPQRVKTEELGSNFAQAECLLTTPIFINHGDSDTSVNVEFSRYAVRMLQRWGYDVLYHEHPGKGHAASLNADKAVVEWFLTHRLNRNPRHVLLRAPTLAGADAHWVHAEQREDPFEFMVVDAAISGNTITVTSQNVLQLRLNPAKELLDTSKPFRLFWNGRQIDEPQLATDGQIILRIDGYTPGKLFKKAVGPTPFAIVVGTTSNDERMRRFCRLLAERYRDEWKGWLHAEPRYFVDTEMTDEQIRAYSLILFGGPEENAVTAKLIKGIPLTVEPAQITIDGRAFPVANAAVTIVYPHPLNDDRDVRVIAANSADAMFWAGESSDWADYVIDDGRVGPDYDYFRNIVAWGQFDCHWRMNEKYLTVGDPSQRALTPVRQVPAFLTAAVPDKQLALSNVLETTSTGSFVRMRRDLNWQNMPMTLGGTTYSSGIAVRCWDQPCKATYDLTGGDWKSLKATIGIEVDTKPADIEPWQRAATRVVFVVRGDGKELYKSKPFGVDSPPVTIDVDVSGVKVLELESTREERRGDISSSVDWADIRLEK